MMNIDFANLQLQYQKYKTDIDEKIQSILKKSNYILGEEVQELEGNLEKFTGAKYAITCSSGTDALLLAMMAADIEPNDEIITTNQNSKAKYGIGKFMYADTFRLNRNENILNAKGNVKIENFGFSTFNWLLTLAAAMVLFTTVISLNI